MRTFSWFFNKVHNASVLHMFLDSTNHLFIDQFLLHSYHDFN